jgi:anaerobic selenocysteine-containing dehydrogenase
MTYKQPALDLSPPVSDEIRKTTCYMCACRCGIDVHMKAGKVAYIEGNRDHPVNKGVLCAKGSAGIMQHNAPARLRKPLKRVGDRGSGEFEEIEWDEALKIATDWLAPMRRKSWRFSPAAINRKALHRSGQRTLAHPITQPTAGSVPSTWPRRASIRSGGILGIRPARLGPYQAVHAVRRGRGSRQQPD